MLSPESTATVRATLPVIGGAIENITARFYEMMFADNPELLRDLFNRGNQANGEQRSALAGSIAAFAAILVEPSDGRPDTMLARIANKHASLGVTVDQYEIVHKYLFAAIAEELGDAVTPEVAAAWDEVYWLMADALITLEADLYRDAGEGWLQATVLDRRRETEDVISLTLRPATSHCPSNPASTSALRSLCPTAPGRSASTACRAPPSGTTGGSPSSGCAAATFPKGRCPTGCTRTSRPATR